MRQAWLERWRTGAARIARGVRLVLAWRWTALLAKMALGALGLLVLAAIGRSALAGNAVPPPALPPSVTAASPAPPPPPSATAAQGITLPAAIDPSPPLRAAPVEDAGAAAAATPSRRATPDDPVFLNQAGFEDLRRLPGVGPKRAQAILSLRQRLGLFRQVEDLLKVKGIGRSTLKKLRPLVRLDRPAGAGSS